MHTNVKPALPVVLALFVLTIAACTQHPFGIFASIQRERKIPLDRNLGKELTVGALAKAGGTYFAATGALYYREQDDPATGTRPLWGAAAAPAAGDQSYRTMSLVAADLDAGERVYAVFVSPDATDSGVYEINPASPTDPPQSIFTPPGGVLRINNVFTINDGTQWLLASAATTDEPARHRLYASSDGETFGFLEGTELANATWVGVATNGTAVAYLSTTGFWRHPAGITPGTPPEIPLAIPPRGSGAIFTGIFYDEVGDLLWVADNRGHLYTSDDFGDTWVKGPENPVSTSNDTAIPFTVFAGVPRGGQTIIIVGTGGYGLRVVGVAGEVDANTPVSPPQVTGSNYQGSGLASSAIVSLFVDPDAVSGFPVETADGPARWDGHLLFVGTVQKGLWRTLSSVSGPYQWVRE